MTGRTRKADKELTDSIEGGIDVADMQRPLARDLLDIRGDHKGYQHPCVLAFSPDDAYCSPWRNMRHTLSFGGYRHHTVRHQDVSLADVPVPSDPSLRPPRRLTGKSRQSRRVT
jgi:hypothetical protein